MPKENISFFRNLAQRGGAIFVDQKSSGIPFLAKLNREITIAEVGLSTSVSNSCPLILDQILQSETVSFAFFHMYRHSHLQSLHAQSLSSSSKKKVYCTARPY